LNNILSDKPSYILNNLIYGNDIEDNPSLINLIIDKLNKFSYEDIIKFMGLCTDNKTYFCNNIIFYVLASKFKMPNSVNNLYELSEYLKESKIYYMTHFLNFINLKI